VGVQRRSSVGFLIRNGIVRLIIYVVLIAGAIAFIWPFLWLIGTSLKTETEAYTFPPTLIGSGFHFENYPNALAEFPFLQGLRNTLIIVVGVETGRLLSCSFAAYAFARFRFPLRTVLFAVVLSTMMLPYHVTLLPQYLVFRDIGWLNTYLPLVVPAFFGVSAFNIFLLRQFFLGIPREYDDAAAIDGCTRFGTFWRIAIPMAMPAIGAVAIFTFLDQWNDYFGPLIYLGRQETYTLALEFKIWQQTTANAVGGGQGYKNQPFNHILAIATLVTIVPLLVFFFCQRYFIQGVVISGIKG
jgi:ABC-type glycerol-3-phosphate transport system permease component